MEDAAAARGRWTQWEEEVVSNDRGRRLVHYYFRGEGGARELAVVGRERSPRHMSYAVQGRLLRALAAAAGAVAVAPSPSRSPQAAGSGADGGGAPRRWRSRREVVDWLSSLVSGKIPLPSRVVFLADLAVDSGYSVRVSPVFGSICSAGREEALHVAFCVEISRVFARFCSDSGRRDACLDVFCAVNDEFLWFVGLCLWRATSRTPWLVDLFVWIWARLWFLCLDDSPP